MYNNDDQNRQQSGQGPFVRRPIPQQSKFGGGEKTNSYQSNPGYSPSYNGGDRGNSYSNAPRQYGAQQRGHDGGGYRGGGTGGYRSGGTGGYRSGGYGGSRDSGGSTDRLIRQNDIIIKMLKDIRDRLPAPPGYRDLPDTYGSGSEQQQPSYAGGGDTFAAPQEQAYAGGEQDNFDTADNGGQSEFGNAQPQEETAAAVEDSFEPEPGNS